jgi:hypothetical protein
VNEARSTHGQETPSGCTARSAVEAGVAHCLGKLYRHRVATVGCEGVIGRRDLLLAARAPAAAAERWSRIRVDDREVSAFGWVPQNLEHRTACEAHASAFFAQLRQAVPAPCGGGAAVRAWS